MAVPSFEELLTRWGINSSTVEQPFSDGHILDFATKLDGWEILANFVGIPPSKIDSIKAQGVAELRPMRMLECWKRRRGSKATYGAMIHALLQIDRTDLAEYIIGLIKRSASHNRDAQAKHVTVTANVSTQCSSLVFPPSPSSSSGAEGLSPPRSLPNSPSAMAAQEVERVKLTLEELEREFFDLIVCTEATLTKFCNQEHLDKIIQRFRMLPVSIKRQYQTDDNYSKIRRMTLTSSTIKELFDNLTEFKHWSYMSPEILTHILQDVPIDDMHQKIKEYTGKLATFKASTKLRDLIGISFSIPDYYIELTMIVEGWEDKTILDAEKSTINILKRSTYGGQNISIGWKAVSPGSIKLVFVVMKSVISASYSSDELREVFQENGVMKMCIDDYVFYDQQGFHKLQKKEEEEIVLISPKPTKLRASTSNERKRVPKSATSTAGFSVVGAGAGIGALIGCIVPGVGTIIGAATIGGFIRAKRRRQIELQSEIEVELSELELPVNQPYSHSAKKLIVEL